MKTITFTKLSVHKTELSLSKRPKQWALCSWGHVTTIFLKIFYIMGYNLKNATNGNSISKIPKWQSLRSLALKNEILWWFEFQKKKKICMEILALSSNSFHTNLLNFFKIQSVIKSHFLMPGASNLVVLMFSTCFFHFWHSLSCSP